MSPEDLLKKLNARAHSQLLESNKTASIAASIRRTQSTLPDTKVGDQTQPLTSKTFQNEENVPDHEVPLPGGARRGGPKNSKSPTSNRPKTPWAKGYSFSPARGSEGAGLHHLRGRLRTARRTGQRGGSVEPEGGTIQPATNEGGGRRSPSLPTNGREPSIPRPPVGGGSSETGRPSRGPSPSTTIGSTSDPRRAGRNRSASRSSSPGNPAPIEVKASQGWLFKHPLLSGFIPLIPSIHDIADRVIEATLDDTLASPQMNMKDTPERRHTDIVIKISDSMGTMYKLNKLEPQITKLSTILQHIREFFTQFTTGRPKK